MLWLMDASVFAILLWKRRRTWRVHMVASVCGVFAVVGAIVMAGLAIA